MKSGAVGVAAVAILLVAGGLFFGLGGLGGEGSADGSAPQATLPPSTVAPPAPAVVGTEPTATDPAATFPEGTETLPVPNVIGVSQATAESRLTDFEIQLTTVTATEPKFLDSVSEQSPAAAERLPAGGTVSITVTLQPRPETVPADPVPVGEFTTVVMTSLEDGDCGNGSVVDQQLVYERVDCDEFHDVQLITRFDVEDGPAEYDALALDELVYEQCLEPYREFLGVELSDSQLRLLSARPNDVRYDRDGERTSLCVVYPRSTVRFRGSAEGSLW